MSDITIAVLHDRSKYPDDMEITLATGDKVTVGAWREAVLPKGDLTIASDRWARREQQLQEAVQGLQQQLAEAVKERPAAQTPASPSGYDEEEIIRDPVLSVLNRRLEKKIEELETAHDARLRAHEDTFMRDRYTAKLNELGDRYNSRFNTDGKKPFNRDGLLEYATKNQVVNLDVAYDAYTRNDEIDLIRREAEARGEERGREKSRLPTVPMGRRRGPTKPEGLPASLQELTDETIENDPEMIAAVRGEDQ